MYYNQLGVSGLRVSPICLGTMMFGGRASLAISGKIVGLARDAGINFIDTADVYTSGESERITGKLIKRDRDQWVLASKTGNATGNGVHDRGLSRKHIIKSVEDSLGRLKTDYMDILYFHLDDLDTPVEESLGAIDDLIRAGKIRYWGVSNYSGWRIAMIAAECAAMGVSAPVVCQPYYNAMNRMPEIDILPACDHYGLGIVPYSPLARGVLTGKYGTSMDPVKGSRAASGDKRILDTEFRQESLDMAQEIKTHAEKYGITAGQFAFNWVLNNALVTSVLAGPRTIEQWNEYLKALNYSFTAEDEALVNSLVSPGHPSTPGYSDPKYPYQGRQPMTG